jgi:phosphoesterase RecJ-like protein
MRRVGGIYRADEWHAMPLLNIDLHVTNTHFGTYNWVEPSCVATSEMVLELCDRLGVAVDADIARCLLYGIIGDTQGLRTDNVTPRLLGKVMRLLEAGAPPLAQVMDQIFSRRPFNLIRAWEKALETMQLDAERGVVWAFLTRQARGEAGWNDTDLQGMSSFLIAADEASLAAVFVEKDDGRVEVGMRARVGYDVARVALSFGGGGHPQAAGCEMDGPLEAAIERVVASLKSLTCI